MGVVSVESLKRVRRREVTIPLRQAFLPEVPVTEDQSIVDLYGSRSPFIPTACRWWR